MKTNTESGSSALIQPDPLTEQTYTRNKFSPATEVTNFSYTSSRVAKRVYNEYQLRDDFTVFGYYTDWGHYDGRLDPANQGNLPLNEDCGRGVDISLLNPKAYDKLIIGFLGVVGDEGEKRSTIEAAATFDTYEDSSDTMGFGRALYQVTFTDPWADVLAYLNCGFPGWVSNDVQSHFNQNDAMGVLGALRDLQKKNSNLRLGMSIGGWTMSHIFSSLSRNPSQRSIFIESILDILSRFPMFTDLDIDWEYPGVEGNGNPHANDDAQHFQTLVRELRIALDGAGRSDVKISIAVGAKVSGLKKADIPGMINAGVDGINLMTYDFFGTNWADKLGHHTNLYPTGNAICGEEVSIEQSVDYLEEQGVNLKKVFIGYAAYSRSAKNAEISSFSPLKGIYSEGIGTVTGSFESGVSEWYDIINNYLDLENQSGRSGYKLYTDKIADADYLYNPNTQHFISLDTPRSVKAKGEYVVSRGLGGLFTWTVDMDNGVLVNAAREGLGYTKSNSVIDMTPFYFGEQQQEGPKAVISGNLSPTVGATIDLSSSSQNAVSFHWSAPNLPFNNSTTESVTAPANTAGSFPVSLTVTDVNGKTDTTSVTVNVSDSGPVDDIPRWQPEEPYKTPGTKVRNNYQSQGEKVYINGFYAEVYQEPGDPSCTAAQGSGLPWSEVTT